MKIMGDSAETGTAAETFRRLYWDTALAWSDPVLHALRELAGMEKVVFGTDFPYLRKDIAVRERHRLEDTDELSVDERKLVLGENALELFPRFRKLYGIS